LFSAFVRLQRRKPVYPTHRSRRIS